jgi:organic radical activating enzyme
MITLSERIERMIGEEESLGRYRVNEIFGTVQGEGILAGKSATFIRLQGCDVGCVWCDTKYTWPTEKSGGRPLGLSMATEDIMMEVRRHDRNHVVITGGEPVKWNLDKLLHDLHKEGYYTQLETSGQQWLRGVIKPRWITWSPKESLEWDGPGRFYKFAQEVKWVVDEALPWEKVWNAWLRTKRQRVIPPYFVLMPEGCPPRSEMVEKALRWLSEVPQRAQMHWRYGDRIQHRIGVR